MKMENNPAEKPNNAINIQNVTNVQYKPLAFLTTSPLDGTRYGSFASNFLT